MKTADGRKSIAGGRAKGRKRLRDGGRFAPAGRCRWSGSNRFSHECPFPAPGAGTRARRLRPRLPAGPTHRLPAVLAAFRSEEHTSELQSLMRISYAVFCLKKKNHNMKERK